MTALETILNQFIEQSGQLYGLPDIYQKLDTLLKSERTSITDISLLISSDAVLTAQVLKLANSPAFGFKAEISSIDRAIILIGTHELKNIVLMEVIIKNFNSTPCHVIKMEDFWRRSAYQAIIAKNLALHNHYPEPNQLFTCAILSQIGELVTCSLDSDKTEQVIKKITAGKKDNSNLFSLYAMEQQVFGFTYNQLSSLLLSYWKIPDNLTQPIALFSESPEQINAVKSGKYKTEAYILYCASVYSFLLEMQDTDILDAEFLLAQIDKNINETLNIDEVFINELLIDIELDAMALLSAIFPDISSIY